jgi:uncharacterized protein YraI
VAAVVPAVPASASTCPDNVWSNKDNTSGHTFTGSGVNIRTGPLTTCTSVGLGYPGHNVQYHCYKVSSDGFTWSHITDITTAKSGWVRDGFLSDFGAVNLC